MAQVQANPPATPVKQNQRRSRRQPPKSSTKARDQNALGLGNNIAVSILDVSETGIRLVLKEDLPKGHEFEVTLESASYRPFKVVAEVVWSVPTANGQFCVGARLQKPIPFTELSALARM